MIITEQLSRMPAPVPQRKPLGEAVADIAVPLLQQHGHVALIALNAFLFGILSGRKNRDG